MQLRTIEKKDWGEATDILMKGFPHRSLTHWANGFRRLENLKDTGLTDRIGYFLEHEGRNIGITLTFRTKRPAARGKLKEFVNLSGWYVDDAFRWYAPRMLSEVLREDGVLFTDLTPIPAIREMLPRLDFRPWNEGVLAASLPQIAGMWRKGARVVTLDRIPDGALLENERKLLEDHEELGCISCAIQSGGQFHPLVLQKKMHKGVPCARVIYAPSRKFLVRHLANVLGFLLRKGIFVIFVECDADECPAGTVFFRRSIKFFKGEIDRDVIDFAYSEMVLLDL